MKNKELFNIRKNNIKITWNSIDDDGDQVWYFCDFHDEPCKDKLFHREDGPAIIKVNGDLYWYMYGMAHRENAPAIESIDGSRYWYKYGQLHRKDGPAVIEASGREIWFYCGSQVNCRTQVEFNKLIKLYSMW